MDKEENELNYPIIHFRVQDFDMWGNLRSSFFKNKLLIIFVYVKTCFHCDLAKSSFQKSAKYFYDKNKFQKIIFGAIQIDGELIEEKNCFTILQNILEDFRGYPDYAVFFNGIPIYENIEDRTFTYLIKRCDELFYKLLSNNSNAVSNE